MGIHLQHDNLEAVSLDHIEDAPLFQTVVAQCVSIIMLGLLSTTTGCLYAAPDDAQTTLAFDPSRIGFDATQIELDFAGLRYDPDSFVKVDLVLVPSDSPSLAR